MSRGITMAQAKDLGIIVPGVKTTAQNKYGVAPKERRTFVGKVYASRAEAIRAGELFDLVQAGGLLDVIEQPRLWLGVRENVYVPDFLVIPLTGSPWFEDVKGMETAAFKKNVKLWMSYGRLELRILKRERGAWSTRTIPGLSRTSRGYGQPREGVENHG